MKLIATLGLLILTNIQVIFAQTANDWYKKGETAYNARKYDEAIKSFDNAINQNCQFMDKAYYFGSYTFVVIWVFCIFAHSLVSDFFETGIIGIGVKK